MQLTRNFRFEFLVGPKIWPRPPCVSTKIGYVSESLQKGPDIATTCSCPHRISIAAARLPIINAPNPYIRMEAVRLPRPISPRKRGNHQTLWRIEGRMVCVPESSIRTAVGEGELAIYNKHTNRTMPPTEAFNEAWVCVGRRGGKSLIASLIAIYLACFRDYSS